MLKPLLALTLFCLPALPARSQSFDYEKEFPSRTIFAWKPGMRFVMPVRGSGFGCPLLPLKGATFKGTDLYSRGDSFDEKTLAGQTLTFQRLDAFVDRGSDNARTDGREQVAVVFKAANGRQYAHIINENLARLKQDGRQLGAPCLIALDDVEKARQLLVGQTLFVRRQYAAAGSTRDEVTYLPKLVPVKITKAGPGEGSSPVRLTFEYVGVTPRQSQERDFVLSATNAYKSGDGQPLSDDFRVNFSFQDPRATAGVASETHWRAIQQGRLVKGMSLKEVELAMGKPQRKSESMEEERNTVWSYNNFQGKQWELLFVNGLLDRYVNFED